MNPSWLHTVACVAILSASSPAAAQITLTDDLGQRVVLTSVPRRIVSLAPSITETLFAIGAADQVAGVTTYCNYPDLARTKPRVGGMVSPSMEAIVALAPDLIVVSTEGNLREDAERLRALSIPLFVTNPRTLAGIESSIEQLGVLTGHEDAARQLAARMRARDDVLRRRVGSSRVRALLLVSVQPLMAVGSRTFLAELLEAAGARNLAADAVGTYPVFSREAITQMDPEVVLVMSDAFADTAVLPSLFPEWRMLTAYRNGRIVRIDADLVSRPGPRAVEGLEELYNALHGSRP